MNIFKKLWRGEYSLAKTYWLFGVVVNVFLGFPINLYDVITPQSQVQYAYYLIGYLALYAIYNVIACVGLWRSASSYQGPAGWKYFSKFIAALTLASFIAIALYLTKTVFTNNNSNQQNIFSMYACTNISAQNEEECKRNYVGTTKFTVDTTRGDVFTTTTNVNGNQFINKLDKCVIIDNQNWRCGGNIDIETFPNGNLATTYNIGTQMVDGNITTSNYRRILSNGNKTIQESIIITTKFKKP